MNTAPPPPGPNPSAATIVAGLLVALAQAFAGCGLLGKLFAAYLERAAQRIAMLPAKASTDGHARETTAPREPQAPPARSWFRRLRRWRAAFDPLSGLRHQRAAVQPHPIDGRIPLPRAQRRHVARGPLTPTLHHPLPARFFKTA